MYLHLFESTFQTMWQNVLFALLSMLQTFNIYAGFLLSTDKSIRLKKTGPNNAIGLEMTGLDSAIMFGMAGLDSSI